ncbi:MAG TPA: hypothetical protein VFO97_00855, partial [Desertimonas sp.]|nr:hypothetical protein [Desertimonas sp.]
MKRITRLAPLLLCLGLGATVTGSDIVGATTPPDSGPSGDTAPAGSVKIGFITKFPVDFYDTMVDAAETWNEAHPE